MLAPGEAFAGAPESERVLLLLSGAGRDASGVVPTPFAAGALMFFGMLAFGKVHWQ